MFNALQAHTMENPFNICFRCIGVSVQTDIADLKKSVPHIVVGNGAISTDLWVLCNFGVCFN